MVVCHLSIPVRVSEKIITGDWWPWPILRVKMEKKTKNYLEGHHYNHLSKHSWKKEVCDCKQPILWSLVIMRWVIPYCWCMCFRPGLLSCICEDEWQKIRKYYSIHSYDIGSIGQRDWCTIGEIFKVRDCNKSGENELFRTSQLKAKRWTLACAFPHFSCPTIRWTVSEDSPYPNTFGFGGGFGAPLQAQRPSSASVISQAKDNFESIKSQYGCA